MTYKFHVGQRVRHTREGWTGEVTGQAPGDGNALVFRPGDVADDP
jgi:hypothetical protein